jgi:uncharacterized protein YodC (DUF2158 family)
MNEVESIFSVGGLVQLKSGGPSLTIRSVEKDEIAVEWFEGDKLKKHSFLAAQLKLVPEREISDLERARAVAFLLRKAASSLPGFDKIDPDNTDSLIDHVLNHQSGTTE